MKGTNTLQSLSMQVKKNQYNTFYFSRDASARRGSFGFTYLQPRLNYNMSIECILEDADNVALFGMPERRSMSVHYVSLPLKTFDDSVKERDAVLLYFTRCGRYLPI